MLRKIKQISKKTIILFTIITMLSIYLPILSSISFALNGFRLSTTQEYTVNEIIPEPLLIMQEESVNRVTGIELEYDNISIVEGTSFTLNATIFPNNASNKTLYWSSTDETIATVENGVVNSIKPGNVKITVISEDGGFSAVCDVNVEKSLGSGFCGDNLTWTCSESGLLRIDGTGPMWNYKTCTVEGTARTTAPWRDLYINSIILPNRITHIGNSAFFNLENATISEVNLPDSVISIGENAFCSSSLENITLPHSLETIGSSAFMSTNLTEIEIPDSVVTMGDSVFMYCFELKNIKLSNSLSRIEGQMFWGSALTSINIPSSVSSIGRGAFLGTNLLDVTVPNTVLELESVVFAECEELKSIKFPDNVNSFETGMMYGCKSLRDVVLPKNIKNIPYQTFMDCVSLETIELPESIENIDLYAFKYCEKLNEIVIPNSVKNIEESAFSDCINLKTISLSNSLDSIGSYAFNKCEKLENIIFPDSLKVIKERAFQGCSNISEIVIPFNVESIEDGVFVNCSSLSKVYIDGNITKLGEYTFSGCNTLKLITMPCSIKSVGKGAFYNCYNLNIFYYGNSLKWDSIEIDQENSELTDAERYNITLDYNEITYTGEKIEPKINVISNGITMLEEEDYTVEYLNNIVPGTANIIINFVEGETIKLPFIINKIDASNAIVSNTEEFTYDGIEKKPEIIVILNEKKLEKDIDYIVDYSNNINAGTGKCIINFIGNFKGTITKEFIINPIDATKATIDEIEKQFYTGIALKPDTKVFLEGNELQKGIDYTVTYANNISAGIARIYITFINNYYRSNVLQCTFEIIYEWDEGTIIKEPTCEGEGEILYKCKADSNITKIDTIEPLGHSYNIDWTIDRESTCAKKGEKSIHCSVCNSKKENSEVEIELKEHEWNEGEITSKPTNTETGVKTYTCKNCSSTKTELVDILKYSINGIIESNLTEDESIIIQLYKEGTIEIFAEVKVSGNNTNYSIQSVPAGNYTLKCIKNNHIKREYSIIIDDSNITQNIQICLIGDIDGDGKVNIKDWVRMHKHINETNLLTDYKLLCADVNEDGKVNIKDWNRLYNHITEVSPLW